MTASRRRQTPEVVIEPRAIDVATAARVYGLGEGTIRELVDHEGFPHVRVGRRIIIPVAQADAWLAARATVGTAIEAAS